MTDSEEVEYRAILAKALKAREGDSNDDEIDALWELAHYAGALIGVEFE